MKVLLYSTDQGVLSKRVLSILQRAASREQVEVFRDIHYLMQRLSLNLPDISILILLVQRQQVLSDLLLIRNHIIGHRVIMVLPDQEPETLSRAHLLYPRYLSYMDSDFKDLNAVLDKMIHYIVMNEKIKDMLNEPSPLPLALRP